MLNQKYCSKCSGWVKKSHIHFLDGKQKVFNPKSQSFCYKCGKKISPKAKRCSSCYETRGSYEPIKRRRQCLSCKEIFFGVRSDKYYGFCSSDCTTLGKATINCNKCGHGKATLDKRTCKDCLYKQKNKKICKICKNVFYKYLNKNSYLEVCSEKCLKIGNFCLNCHSPLHKIHNLCFNCDNLVLNDLLDKDNHFTCSVCLLLKRNTLKQQDNVCLDCK